MSALKFFVPGIPKPGGSKRAFIPKGWTRAIITDDCETSKDWRASVAQMAAQARGARPILNQALVVMMSFYMPRPKAHYNAKGEIKESALTAQVTKAPDVLKLARSTEDALKGIVWTDDKLSVELHLHKNYVQPYSTNGEGSDTPGVFIVIYPKPVFR